MVAKRPYASPTKWERPTREARRERVRPAWAQNNEVKP